MFRWNSLITRWVGSRRRLLFLGFLLVLVVAGYRAVQLARAWQDPRNQRFVQWWQGEPADRAALITVQREVCPGAPFVLPADGYIGLFYGDPRGPYSDERPHQGIDIFSAGEPGETPVYAAYDGYLTREESWRSTVIIRVPDDPLRPGRQIWLYYTHMADESGENDFIVDAFPPGTRELFVEQGTLLGYTGNYNGNALRDIWVHLHFSIVLADSNGSYRNELEFANTIDPSPYLGMPLNESCAPAVVSCTPNPVCTAGP